MSSRLTLILAAFFLLAALLAGYWGIVLSRPAAVPAPVTPAGEQPVVAVAPPPPRHRNHCVQPSSSCARHCPPIRRSLKTMC